MRIDEVVKKFVPCPYAGSIVKTPIYHGTVKKFARFNRPAHGIFFTPYESWARGHYGNNVIACYANIQQLYVLDWGKPQDEEIIDALFDRDYELVARACAQLAKQGYSAMQTTTESAMICVFPSTQLCNAKTGKEM